MPPRQETRSISSLFSDIAYRKSRAAAVRFAGSNPGQESAREVYLAACATIGQHLSESYGFKYAKSGPQARRRSGEFTFEVSFQSSHHNVAGQHVMLIVHAGVRSAKLKQWREAHGSQHTLDSVAGGQIGNLRPDCIWRTWELADPNQREEVIRNIIQVIEDVAFPFFAKFEDLLSLFQLLVNEDLRGMSINGAIEFLVCFADHATARLAAVNFLQRRPNLVRAYQRDLARSTDRGLDLAQQSGYANKLALASLRFGFGDLTAKD